MKEEVLDIRSRLDEGEITDTEATRECFKILRDGDSDESVMKLLSSIGRSEVIEENTEILNRKYSASDNYRIKRDVVKVLSKLSSDVLSSDETKKTLTDATKVRVENVEPVSVEYADVSRLSVSEDLESYIQDETGISDFEFESLEDFDTIDNEGRVKSKENIVSDGQKFGIVTRYHGRDSLKLEIIRETEKRRIRSSSESARLIDSFDLWMRIAEDGQIEHFPSSVVESACELVEEFDRQEPVRKAAMLLSNGPYLQEDSLDEIVDSFLTGVNQIHSDEILHQLERLVTSLEGEVPYSSEIEKTIRKLRGIEVGERIQVVPPSKYDLKTSYMAIAYLSVDSKIKRKLVSLGFLKP